MSLTWNSDVPGVGEIIIDRDDRLNSLDLPDFARLAELIDQAPQRGIRALLIRGSGRAFCTGRNLKGIEPDEDIGASVRLINEALLSWHGSSIPTIAAVHGHCLGAGVGLALLADVTIVADDTQFASPFGSLGAVPDCGFHTLMTRRLGQAVAKDMVLTGRSVSGAEAEARGLVARSATADVVLPQARAMAAELARGPGVAFAESLTLIDAVDDAASLAMSLDAEAEAQAAVSLTEDFRVGLRAFVRKKQPTFIGR